jgi:hypothetical protein
LYPDRIAQDLAQHKAHEARIRAQLFCTFGTHTRNIARLASRYGYTSELVNTYLTNKALYPELYQHLQAEVAYKVKCDALAPINKARSLQGKPPVWLFGSDITDDLLYWHDLCFVKPGEDISGTTMNEDFNNPMSTVLDYLNPIQDLDYDAAQKEQNEFKLAVASQYENALAIDTARVKALSRKHGRNSDAVKNYLESHVRDDLRVAVTTALDELTNAATPAKTDLPLDAGDDDA